MIIEVKVTAGAKSESFRIDKDGQYFIRVREKAIEGKANKAIIEYMSNILNIKKTCIRILKGEKTSRKLLDIDIDENIFKNFLKTLEE